MYGQSTVPIFDIPQSSVRAASNFSRILGVTSLGNSWVLANDAERRQLVLLDTALRNPKVILDSVADGATSYGRFAKPFIRFLADTVLFPDLPSKSFIVISPAGSVVRTMALPRTSDFLIMATSPSSVDVRGNLYYRGLAPEIAGNSEHSAPLDSAPIIRANFDSRRIDTVAKVKTQRPSEIKRIPSTDGVSRSSITVNPLVSIDEWVVESGGALAVVRGHDYHIDWLLPDGSWYSAPKMPFDWKRVSEAERLALMDSARTAETTLDSSRTAKLKREGNFVEVPGRGRVRLPDRPVAPIRVDFAPSNEMADYYPAIRTGAVIADLDGNIWILPTTSAQSKNGELVYDVVDRQHGLKERVRLPPGRSVVGFGHGGVVFLAGPTSSGEWFLERAVIPSLRSRR